jgi:hypothetical protein
MGGFQRRDGLRRRLRAEDELDLPVKNFSRTSDMTFICRKGRAGLGENRGGVVSRRGAGVRFGHGS